MSNVSKRSFVVILSVLFLLNSVTMAHYNLKSIETGFSGSFYSVSEQTINIFKARELHSFLREYDLNGDTQKGFSITYYEYEKLTQLWKNLTDKEKTIVLSGSIDNTLPCTFANILIYGINNAKEWSEVIKDLDKIGAKGSSLTFSNVKSLVTLETAHNTLLDLLYKEKNMIINGKLCIDPVIKYHTVKRQNQGALDRLEKWEKLINDSQNFSNQKKLNRVNSFFNDLIIARSDNDYNKNCDYWQSPIETLVRGKGDCEDFAIAKYVSLRILGIPKDQLLISIVRLPRFGELHAVLSYYPNGENDPWVMDNLSYDYMGYYGSRLIRMSLKISQDNIYPLIGFNENIYVEFRRGMKKHYLDKDPINEIPMFKIAINNSKGLLSNLSR